MTSQMKGRVLVTGGAGFIGSHVTDHYLQLGYEVTVVDDLSTGKVENVPNAAEFVRADIGSPEVRQLLEAMIDPDTSRRLKEPLQIFAQLESIWSNAMNPVEPQMSSPFDMMSAELIRSTSQLMELFADEFPGLFLPNASPSALSASCSPTTINAGGKSSIFLANNGDA